MRRSILVLTILLGLGAVACALTRGDQQQPTALPHAAATVAPTSAPTALVAPTIAATPIGWSVCVLAYEDSNGNGIQDAGERALAGVTLELRSNGSEASSVLTSGAAALTCFGAMPAGSYHLWTWPPPPFTAVQPGPLIITVDGESHQPVSLGFLVTPPLPDGQVTAGEHGKPIALVAGEPSGEAFYLLTETELVRTEDGGRRWEIAGSRPPASHLVVGGVDLDWLLAGDGMACLRGGPEAPMYVSHDGAKNWSVSPGGLNLRPVALHPSDPAVAWAIGCDGPYRTDDGGWNWQRLSAEMWGVYLLSDVAPVREQPDTLYAAGASEGGSGAVFRSADGGGHWVTIADMLELWVTAILPHPSDPDQVWFATPAGVWHTQDAGASWEYSFSGLESVAVGDDLQFDGKGLLTLARDQGGMLYLGTMAGLFRSGDGGIHWQPVPGAPWHLEPMYRLFVGESGYLWAQTRSGVFGLTPPLP